MSDQKRRAMAAASINKKKIVQGGLSLEKSIILGYKVIHAN